MKILGISAYYHDSAAALLDGGEIVAAAQEERFTRIRHDASFPRQAAAYCLREGGLRPDDLDGIAFYEKPFIKFERLLETHLAVAPRGLTSFLKSMPVWIKDKLWMKDALMRELGVEKPVFFAEHHESHAASAFFPSPFESAAVLTMDGVGEWATTSYGIGNGGRLRLLAQIDFPHSLGLLYSAFTYYLGFKVNSGEYKVMGLAPYGRPVYAQKIVNELIALREDGSFRLNMKYFGYCGGLRMTNRRFDALFGGPPRDSETRLEQRHMDLARSIQEVCEEAMLRMARHVRKETGMPRLCLAGGVALNCVGNGRIVREKIYDQIWVQPAAGDAGGAIGAALAVWHHHFGAERKVDPAKDSQRGSLLGPEYADDEIEPALKRFNAVYSRLDEGDLVAAVCKRLSEGKVVGWFHGRMEFGPRALGARSILADPRFPEMQKTLNLKIKFRESFRPFAPAVLERKAADYFDCDHASPYMLLVAPVREERCKRMSAAEESAFGIEKLNVLRSDIPAVTHVDYSARLQTVNASSEPLFHRLLESYGERYGCPLLVNTSFNVRGEPIVCRPEEAYVCFMRTGMDCLVVGGYFLEKESQPKMPEDSEYLRKFEAD